MYAGVDDPHIKSMPVVSTDDERWITEEQFNILRQGAGEDFNAITYLKSLDDVSKEDLLKAIAEKNANGNSNENSTNSNSNSNTNSNSNSNANSNSNSNSNSNANAPAYRSTSAVSSSRSVGTSGSTLASAVTADESADDAQSEDSKASPSKAKSYEVSKTPATKSADSNSLIYAVVGVLAIGAVLGFGFMRRRK